MKWKIRKVVGLIAIVTIFLSLGTIVFADQISSFYNALDQGNVVKHDGSRTGERVGYQSYCHPEQGIVIYENEKMPFVTDEGEHVLWTKGDIDCYKERKSNPTATPSAVTKSNTSTTKTATTNNNQKSKIVKYNEYCNGGKEISVYENELITKAGKDGKTYSMTKDDWNCYERDTNKKQVTNQYPTQPSSSLTFHCYDNTYKYWYYTTSGEQCNLNNAKNTGYELCKNNAQQTVYNKCADQCKQSSSEETQICLWAYSGSSATIENSPDKLTECTSEVNKKFSVCLEPCSAEYGKALDQCHK